MGEAVREGNWDNMDVKLLGKSLLVVAAAGFWACSAQAYAFKIKVDLQASPEKGAVTLALPNGAEKASERYLTFAERTHPDVMAHSFAALPNQAKMEKEEGTLDDLDFGLVDDDAIQTVDKDVEYIVRSNKGRNSFVLVIVNRKNEDLSAEVELRIGKMYEPVYRRVYSEDGGKTWTTAAWQPPRESALYPWPIEVPANMVQTVTICLR
jgi:hypothetical protein